MYIYYIYIYIWFLDRIYKFLAHLTEKAQINYLIILRQNLNDLPIHGRYI